MVRWLPRFLRDARTSEIFHDLRQPLGSERALPGFSRAFSHTCSISHITRVVPLGNIKSCVEGDDADCLVQLSTSEQKRLRDSEITFCCNAQMINPVSSLSHCSGSRSVYFFWQSSTPAIITAFLKRKSSQRPPEPAPPSIARHYRPTTRLVSPHNFGCANFTRTELLDCRASSSP